MSAKFLLFFFWGGPKVDNFFFFWVIGVHVYVFAFYMFDEFFMRKKKFLGLYFEIFE
jgi:hypothetical protein